MPSRDTSPGVSERVCVTIRGPLTVFTVKVQMKEREREREREEKRQKRGEEKTKRQRSQWERLLLLLKLFRGFVQHAPLGCRHT